MKRMILFVCLFFFYSAFVQAQPPWEKVFERLGPRIHPEDLRILEFEFIPDPVLEGQRLEFQILLSNSSPRSGRISLSIKDHDEIVTSVEDILIRPGENRIIFPRTGYRFSRREHCFRVEVDIERTRRPIDLAKEFCARKSLYGWTLKEIRVGPLFVEDLDMFPDPVQPGQEVRFRVRLRNEGIPLRGNLVIQDRDQVVVALNHIHIPRGHSEFHFPYTRYSFQRFDHCFTVIVDVERTPHRADAVKEFCAQPAGWTLKP